MVPKSLPGMQTAVQGDSESVSKQAVRILSTGPAQTRSRDVRQFAVSRAGFCPLDQLGLSLINTGDPVGSLHSHGVWGDSQPLYHAGADVRAVPGAQNSDLTAVSTLLLQMTPK